MGLLLATANAIVPLVLAIPLPVGQASIPAAADTDVVQGDNDRHERMTVPVRIGDHGMFRFLLDTGSQNTVLAASVAERLALPSGRNATVVGIAGRLTCRHGARSMRSVWAGAVSMACLHRCLRANISAPTASSASTVFRTSGCCSIFTAT